MMESMKYLMRLAVYVIAAGGALVAVFLVCCAVREGWHQKKESSDPELAKMLKKISVKKIQSGADALIRLYEAGEYALRFIEEIEDKGKLQKGDYFTITLVRAPSGQETYGQRLKKALKEAYGEIIKYSKVKTLQEIAEREDKE